MERHSFREKQLHEGATGAGTRLGLGHSGGHSGSSCRGQSAVYSLVQFSLSSQPSVTIED